MQEVVQRISKWLVQQGHSVTIATRMHSSRTSLVHDGVSIKEFDVSGNWALGLKGNISAYEDFLMQSDFDVVTFFAAQQWATDVALPILKKIKAKKVIVPTGYSALYLLDYEMYYSRMRDWVHEFDMHVFLSNDYRDVNFVKDCGVTNWTLIPNGASTAEFLPDSTIDIRKQLGIPKSDLLLLHIGSFTGVKGHKEAIDITLRLPQENVTLLLIGNNLENFKLLSWSKPQLFLRATWNRFFGKKKIILQPLSREQTVAAYKTADLFLFPSNIECSPIVLFEAAAAGLPFASSNVGNAAEIAEWTNGGIILPTAINNDGFSHVDIKNAAVAVANLLSDKEKLKHMSVAAHASWKEKFTWEIIAKKYEDLYASLLK
jgi:L-malate glycosyltransferase